VAKNRGLDDWFNKEKWVDISAPKEGGGYEKCGRKNAKDSERGYPKCVPSAKADKMSKKEVASAVRRKRSKKQGVGGKPTNVKTFAAEGGSIMKMKAKGMNRGGATGVGVARTGRVSPGKPKGKPKLEVPVRKKPVNPVVRPRPPSGPVVPGGPSGGGKPKKMKGGGMATKGYARGGAMKSKAKSSPVRAPSSKNSGLYGR
jgi:hypothetical protein